MFLGPGERHVALLRQNRSLTVLGGKGRVAASAFASDGCQSWFVKSPRRPLGTNLGAHWHRALGACAGFELLET